jgi:hypothetical protein
VKTWGVLLACLMGSVAAAPTATEIAAQRRDAVVNDPDNPKGMQIRRARAADEAWPDYFCAVYLWPFSAEHYNQTFTALNQSGRKIQFIGNSVFATGGRWYLVLRGNKELVSLMADNVALESGGPAGVRLTPVECILREDPAGGAWIGLVAFPQPAQPATTIMSSFALYGNAGGMHEVLDEEQARRRFAVIRDVTEFIERIYREQQRQKKR